MCGILAYYDASDVTERAVGLQSCLDFLAHRGPDNTSVWHDDHILLGHTRLSILDAGEAAHQPYRFGNLILSYNGEIFNFVELRDELAAIGYTFDTTSDTEIVIKAFDAYGVDCFAKFNGMWAIAVYDASSGELVVSRDRFGQKPLFFGLNAADGNLMFASELQAFEGIKRHRPNFAAIASFLREGTFDVSGATFFEGIFEFPPACYARYTNGEMDACEKYWDYPDEGGLPASDAPTFHALLKDAVALRLRTDVDYCLLLSGGCDSTIIGGIVRDLVGAEKPVLALTFASGDADDESAIATDIAAKLGMEQVVCPQYLAEVEYFDRLAELVRHLGRGHSSPAIVSVSRLYEAVSECGHKVALDGQGADELLAGYKHYHYHLLLDLLRHLRFSEIPAVIKDLFAEGFIGVTLMSIRNSAPAFIQSLMRSVYGYEKFLAGGQKGRTAHNPLKRFWTTRRTKRGLLNGYLLKQHQAGLRNLLYYGDVVAMYSSVENRSPFMDHRLVELSFSAGVDLKVKGGRDKAVLRAHPCYRQFQKQLDRKKVGFNTPISEKFKKRMIEDLKRSDIVDWPVFKHRHLRAFLEDERAFREKYERFLFRLYQVHLWQQQFEAAA